MTPDIKLDELVSLAEAARYFEPSWDEFTDALSPDVVLSLVSRIRELEEALRFYADEHIYAIGWDGSSGIAKDLRGSKARAALAGATSKEEGEKG